MTVSAPETPTNSVAHVRDLASCGLGWEDIVVALRAEGIRVGVNARERIRRIVLSQTARRPLDRRPWLAVSQAGAKGMNTRD